MNRKDEIYKKISNDLCYQIGQKLFKDLMYREDLSGNEKISILMESLQRVVISFNYLFSQNKDSELYSNSTMNDLTELFITTFKKLTNSFLQEVKDKKPDFNYH